MDATPLRLLAALLCTAGAALAAAAAPAQRAATTVELPQVVTIDQTPIDPYYANGLTWALDRSGFPAAWDVTTGSSSVTVAVVDTGVSPVADLAGALVPGHNFVSGNDDTTDDNGHGTAVAGTIAARGDNGLGLAGVCWSCRIMPVKIAGADGLGWDYNLASGIRWAADHGAQVINVSMGQLVGTTVVADAVSYAEAKGSLVVAAAGNAGKPVAQYPAAYPGVLSVAASDAADARYPWSNYGSDIDVAAPGCVLAPLPFGYGDLCGTSFSAPLTTGLAALLLSARPGASAAEVAAAIEKAATPVAGYVRYGRIDALAALAALGVPVSGGFAAEAFRPAAALPPRLRRR